MLREIFQNEAHMVSYRKWDDYYCNEWSDYGKRLSFLNIKSANENAHESALQKIQASLVLEYQYIDKNTKNPKDFTDLSLFIIKKNEYEYKNIKRVRDLCKDELVFGRETLEFIPNISFDSEVMTINNKQFQISTLKSSDKF